MTAAKESKLDPAIVSALYLDHAEDLRRFVYGIVKDWQLAGDVLQATFTKAVEVGHTTQEGSRKAWLFRVAFHEALALQRKKGVAQRAMDKLGPSRQGHAGRSDEPVVRRETVETVRAAIEALPPQQQQVVRLRIYEEKKFVEIAQELNIPLATALARMRAALGKLRTALGQHEDT